MIGAEYIISHKLTPLCRLIEVLLVRDMLFYLNKVSMDKCSDLKASEFNLPELFVSIPVGTTFAERFPGSGVYIGTVSGYSSGKYKVEYNDGDTRERRRHELITLFNQSSERQLSDEFKGQKGNPNKCTVAAGTAGEELEIHLYLS